jgi:hypothetical protein
VPLAVATGSSILSLDALCCWRQALHARIPFRPDAVPVPR